MSELTNFENILNTLMDTEGTGKMQIHTLALKAIASIDLSADAKEAVMKRLQFIVMTTKKHPSRAAAQEEIMEIITRGKP